MMSTVSPDKVKELANLIINSQFEETKQFRIKSNNKSNDSGEYDFN
ncbi:hypothetical protein [Candidatus Hydrogenosomobacter endosymbioticus]|uniref:Uncharacterized protein n=1 Tax=Candidatus Hydrogenosomobacter endosymbioticus TaxID=2558174 RepID=A0ABM7V936_9PROT|nr:hypothetical protein [Candidatus Hydrogenosomobacter endosymbioticus]BDB96275.1 hypothetical protein HYD_4080 [Candidatus Hydrogenosomobacter endosymbioticus]